MIVTPSPCSPHGVELKGYSWLLPYIIRDTARLVKRNLLKNELLKIVK